ncbi:MAG: hypothetical protein ABSB22_08110 [Thermodesulfobacteriota bacterium]|jgi:hypothetical protein
MDLPLITSLDEVLLQVQAGFPRKVLFWGERAGEISSYVTGWMAGKGIDVIVLDGANRFDPYMVSSFAKKASMSPMSLLKRIRIARAFTCYQMAALIEERLVSLLKQKRELTQQQKPWVILLGLITPFLDEDVSEGEVRPLFERSLRKAEGIAAEGIPFFLFQPSAVSENSPFPPFAKGGRLGNSKRAYLTRRLFQFSNEVWKISLEDRELKVILEKRVTLTNSLLAGDLGINKLEAQS